MLSPLALSALGSILSSYGMHLTNFDPTANSLISAAGFFAFYFVWRLIRKIVMIGIVVIAGCLLAGNSAMPIAQQFHALLPAPAEIAQFTSQFVSTYRN